MRNYSKHPFGGALAPSDTVMSRLLAANVAETITVPTNATHLLLATTSDIFVKYFTTAQAADVAVNGTFAADATWVKGAGWTIAAGVATATGAISTNLSETPTVPLIPGQAYLVSYDATRSAGTVTVQIGGTNGTARSSSATFSEVIVAGATTDIVFVAAGFSGTIDNVTVTPVAAVPADNTSGSAPELINASSDEESRTRQIGAFNVISVVSAGTPVVTASFFRS